ncbi:MAG: hypothetical protein ACI84K_001150 [Pseudohongiellaceae bacterium]|jgi:hypothetical protein
MTKPVFVLLHGMGNHSAPVIDSEHPENSKRGSFGDEFVDCMNKAMKSYPGLAGKKIEDLVEIEEIHYNAYFDALREKLADQANDISEVLNASGGGTLNLIPGVIEEILDLQSSFNDDDDKYTHWLDVLIYKTELGEKARIDAMMRFVEILEKHNSENIHVIAHSLGTGIAHDGLHKLYSSQFENIDARIHPQTHKLGSIWLIANVSPLLNSVLELTSPHDSLVKPSQGGDGICMDMYNINHQYDPFTWFAPFTPKRGTWIPNSTYDRHYLSLEPKNTYKALVHGIDHYLMDPLVHQAILLKILSDDEYPADDELQAALDKHRAGSINAHTAKIKETFEGLNLSDADDFSNFMKAIKIYIELAKEMGEEI